MGNNDQEINEAGNTGTSKDNDEIEVDLSVLDETKENGTETESGPADRDEFAEICDALAKEVQSEMSDYSEPVKLKTAAKQKKNKIPVTFVSSVSACLVLLLFVSFFCFTEAGRGILLNTKIGQDIVSELTGSFIDGNITHDDMSEVQLVTSVTQSASSNMQAENTVTQFSGNIGQTFIQQQMTSIPVTQKPTSAPTPVPARSDENVRSILVVGDDTLESSVRGSSDALMIFSVNRNNGTLSAISISRDILMNINGYGNIPLQDIYQEYGADVLVKALEDKFLIKLDGYVVIPFEGFTSLIDGIGGINIVINRYESAFLNKSNYLADKRDKNLHQGMNSVNGNQALAFCRIKQVMASSDTYGDEGRTVRQFSVLSAVFEKMKKMNTVKVIKVMEKCLPEFYTDLTASDFKVYIKAVLSNKGTFKSLTVPVKNSYSTLLFRQRSVDIIDSGENSSAMQMVIFGNVITYDDEEKSVGETR